MQKIIYKGVGKQLRLLNPYFVLVKRSQHGLQSLKVWDEGHVIGASIEQIKFKWVSAILRFTGILYEQVWLVMMKINVVFVEMFMCSIQFLPNWV